MPRGGKKFVFPEGAQHGIESTTSVSFTNSGTALGTCGTVNTYSPGNEDFSL